MLSFIAMIGFIGWYSKAEFDQQYEFYDVRFSGPVRGVNKGTEVRFNGLRFGEVVDLTLDSEAANTVIVQLRVTANYPITTDSFAQLEPSGLTGLNYIQIFEGESNVLMAKSGATSPYSLPGRMSQIETFLDDGGSVIVGAQKAIARVNAVLTPEAINDFHETLSNINILTKKLSDSELDPELVNSVLKSFEIAADEVTKAANEVDTAAADFDKFVLEDLNIFLTRAAITMDELDQTLNAFEVTAGDASTVAIDLSDALNRISNSGLTDLEESASMVRDLVESLNRVIESLEQNPIEFISGEKRETVELPQ
ncbi:MAG: MlaD family protein [Maricaulaceae bacterium]